MTRSGAAPGKLVVEGVDELLARAQLRALVDEYAAAADARDPARFAALFTPDGRFLAYQRGSDELLRDIRGTAALLGTIDNLAAFEQTLHVMANRRILELSDDSGRGEVYALAHHLIAGADGSAEDLVMHIRYDDVYARLDGRWLFEQRTVNIRWIEQRAVAAAPLEL